MNTAIVATLGLLAMVVTAPSAAVQFVLVEQQFPRGPIIADITISDALGEVPKPH